MKTAGSIKVVHDLLGNPWLVVGVADGAYEAHEIRVVRRFPFARSYQAVGFVQAYLGAPETPNQGSFADPIVVEGDAAPDPVTGTGRDGAPDVGCDGPVGHDHGATIGEELPATAGVERSAPLDPPHRRCAVCVYQQLRDVHGLDPVSARQVVLELLTIGMSAGAMSLDLLPVEVES